MGCLHRAFQATFCLTLAIAESISANCLGPENFAANPPVLPKTCNGQWTTSLTGFYWNTHQDGMAFALKTGTPVPVINPSLSEIQEINHLVDTHYATPHSKWQYGFKLGLGYAFTCDGWDVEAIWTEYHTRSKKNIETEVAFESLIPLFSAFSPAQGTPVFARHILGFWKVKLSLLDIELGREFWTSKRLSLRPNIGLRLARVAQDFDIEHKGGSWSPRLNPNQDPFSNTVKLDNIFKGIGIRSGLDTVWHCECGFGFYGNLAASMLYGPFRIKQAEENRLSVQPYSIERMLSFTERFRSFRAILDLGLGIQWSRKFCDCMYEVTTSFGWEGHLFFNQNQLWRINRLASIEQNAPNHSGQNVLLQNRGTLDTQGWNLSFQFDF